MAQLDELKTTELSEQEGAVQGYQEEIKDLREDLPADEETRKNANTLRKGGDEFIKVIDNNQELSDMVKKAFPNTYNLTVKYLKRFEKAKGTKMTNREIKKRLNGFIDSLTPIINYVLNKLRDPRTIEKIKFIENKLNNTVVVLKKSGLIGKNMSLNSYKNVEENSVSELVEEELNEIEENPMLEEFSKALKKDIMRDIKKIRKSLKGSRNLSKEEKAKIKEEIAWKVDGIINFVNDNSGKFVKYAIQAKYLLKKLGAVKSLLKQNIERRENSID